MLHAPQSSAKDARDSLASFKPTFEAIGFHLDVHVPGSPINSPRGGTYVRWVPRENRPN